VPPPPHPHEVKGRWLGIDQHGFQYALDLYEDRSGLLTSAYELDGEPAAFRIQGWELGSWEIRIPLTDAKWGSDRGHLEGKASAGVLTLTYFTGQSRRPFSKVTLRKSDVLLGNFSRMQELLIDSSGTLVIHTEPQDATVVVDGQWVGRSVADEPVTMRVVPRKLTVTVGKLGFKTWTGEVVVTGGGTAHVNAVLER
jgi:hypothetical protein